MEFDSVFLVPMTLFIAIAAVIVAGIIVGGRSRERLLQTVEKSIDSGVPLSTETIQAMGFKPRDDLRTGFILIAIWLAFIVFGVMVGLDDGFAGGSDFDALGPMTGIGAFPGLIGAALVGLHVTRKGGR